MKYLLTSFLSLLLISNAQSQCNIPEADFEDWEKWELDSNYTILMPAPDTVQQVEFWIPFAGIFGYLFNGNPIGVSATNDAQSGDSALMFYVDPNTSPKTIVGDLFTRIGCAEQKSSLDGYYKMENVTAGDSAVIEVIGYKYDSTMQEDTAGYGITYLYGNQTSYETFSVEIDWMDVPDSLVIWMYYAPSDTLNASSIKIDNLTWGQEVGIEPKPILSGSLKLMPNPATDNIALDIDNSIIRDLEIVSMTGKIIYHQSNQSVSQSQRIDISNYESGIYVVKVITEDRRILMGRFVKE